MLKKLKLTFLTGMICKCNQILFQVKALYQKISNDNESLKGLWAAKLNLKGKGGSVTKEDMKKFDMKKSWTVSWRGDRTWAAGLDLC